LIYFYRHPLLYTQRRSEKSLPTHSTQIGAHFSFSGKKPTGNIENFQRCDGKDLTSDMLIE
jgi:hypothetical protein